MEQARAAGIEITNIDFISIEPVINDQIIAAIKNLPEHPLVFTSMSAVQTLHDLLQQQPDLLPQVTVYCIEGRTKEKLERLFPALTVRDTAGNAAALAEKIISDNPTGVVFFTGNLRREELPVQLRNAGISVQELEIYRTVAVENKLDKSYDGILFFSPSAVNSFFSANNINNNTICFAIGNTTATALKQKTSNNIVAAKAPRQENMIAMLIDHFLQ